MKQVIQTSDAPAAIGSYSQAVRAGNFLFLSGQIPLDPLTMTIVENDVKAQVFQVFKNIENILEAAGLNLGAVIKLNVYLTNLSDISIVNEAIAQLFKQPYPARTSVEVSALPKSAAVEIEATAIY